jgi:cysteine synthase
MLIETEAAVLSSYRPRIIPLGDNLYAAAFPFMKIFPAEFCVRKAAQEGWISSQTLVVESSSGNMALGLAIVCNLKGYRLTIVSDYACDPALRRRLEDLGARVEIVLRPSQTGGYQRARLDVLDKIRSENKDHWWVNQYDNPFNPGGYGQFAAQLLGTIGRFDCLVGPVGSGGSMCGTTCYLRELLPELKAVGVDTFGSVLFGQPDQHRPLRGLGNSLLPKNLDHALFDEVHWVSAAEAYTATRMLHRETSLFCGGTSGASWMVASHWARKNPKAKVVCVMPDDGYRYIDTVYNDQYMAENHFRLPALPHSPVQVCHPARAEKNWSCMEWGRRTYSEVTADEALAAAR